jgi:hypothetical protein
MLVSQSLQRAKDGTSSHNDDCLRKKGKVKNETMSIVKIKHKEEKKKRRKEERYKRDCLFPQEWRV